MLPFVEVTCCEELARDELVKDFGNRGMCEIGELLRDLPGRVVEPLFTFPLVLTLPDSVAKVSRNDRLIDAMLIGQRSRETVELYLGSTHGGLDRVH